MSGPSCHAGCPGPIPDVRPILPVELLWFCILVVIASDVQDFPGCPDLPVTPDVRAPFRISGHRYPENVFMLGCASDVWPPSGCPGLPVLSDVRAWPPDVRPLCFLLCFCLVLRVVCQAGCPAYPFTCTTTAIFVLTLYIALLPHGRGLTIHFEQALEHISLSLSLLHTKS